MTRKRLIIHPTILIDPREAATYHLRTAIVDGAAPQGEAHVALCNVWRDPVVAFALYRIWSDRRRLSRDHALIAQEEPHGRA